MALAGLLTVLLLILGASPACQGEGDGATHNITAILAAHPDFTDFSAALVSTGAAAEIDRRGTITVLAVDNAVMARLWAQKPEPQELVRAIYLHALLDYLGAAKLGSIQNGFAQSTSLYQATGKAQGADGIVNITVFRDGRVAAFTAPGASNRLPTAFYQRSIKEMPYDLAVLQVKDLIWSPAPAADVVPAPAPAPVPDLAPGVTDLLSKNGCGGFAGHLAATHDAVAAYERSSAAGGLTVFCPADKAVEAFSSAFKNLTADAQLAVLLYHGVAAHYSAQSLKAINGNVGTLAASDGGSKNHEVNYNLTVRADGDTVKLSSSASATANSATVTKTLVDKSPLAVYLIDAVLLPFSNGSHTAPVPAPASPPTHAPTTTPALAPSPTLPPVTPPPAQAHAPTPAPPVASAPRRHPAPPPEDSTPAPSPDDDGQPPADQKNNGTRDTASWTLGAAAAAALATVFLLW